MKLTLHQYQRDGVLWLVNRPEAALLYEPGLGKTVVTLKALQALRVAGGVRKALVVAPLRVAYQVWSDVGEIGKWDDFTGLRIARLHGPRKAEALAADADVYVINYDGLLWLIESGGLKSLLDRGVDLVVFDELSKLKHPQTRRFRLLKPWLGRFKRRWGLTGTPVANGLIDLFGQCYCLDLGRALGRFITHYRRDFFVPTGYGGYEWVPQRDAEPRIFARLAPLAQSLKAIDCLDLPELVERDVFVELPAAARTTYKALEDELLAVVNDVTLTAANAAVALSKCQQLCGGAVYHDIDAQVATRRDVRTSETIHDAKLEALSDLVDELQGQPLLVAYAYQHELARIRAVLGEKTPALRGGASPREVAQVIEAWNHGDVPVLLAHPAAAGHGLNLQRGGNHICWFTLTYDLELYEQLNHRIWRQGNTSNRVVVHRLVARGTVDVDVRDALARKSGGQEALFAALKRRAGAGDDAKSDVFLVT